MLVTMQSDPKRGHVVKHTSRKTRDWARVGIMTDRGHIVELEAVRKHDGAYVFNLVEKPDGGATREITRLVHTAEQPDGNRLSEVVPLTGREE